MAPADHQQPKRNLSDSEMSGNNLTSPRGGGPAHQSFHDKDNTSKDCHRIDDFAESGETAGGRESGVRHPRELQAGAQLAVDELKSILEAANIGSWDWNLQTGEVRWSENMEKIHSQPAGSF